MKKIYSSILLTTFLMFSACGVSKPKVAEVPVTEPWISVNFPCQDNAVVIVSNDYRFNCAYGGSRTRESDFKTITLYLDVLKKNGWKIESEGEVGFQYVLEKDGKELLIFPTSSSILTADGERNWEGFGIQAEMMKGDK